MSAELKREIERIKGLNMEHDRSSLKEGTTQTVSVMPVLAALGWDTTNPAEIRQEIKAGGRVDIGLHIGKKPAVFIEAKPGKQRHLTDRNKEQLLEYCENREVRLGVLTNGFVWYLYSDAESKATKPNDYAVEINFDNSAEEIEDSLVRFLSKARVRYNYKEVLEDLSDERTDRVLSEKWEEMLQRKHEGLARALWNEVKDGLPQGRGSLDRVRRFIGQRSNVPEDKRPDAVSEEAKQVSSRKARTAYSRTISPAVRDTLRLLQKEPQATYARIAEAFRISTGAASGRIKKAKEKGYIRQMKQGRICTYQVLVELDGESYSRSGGGAFTQLGTKRRATPSKRPEKIKVFEEEIDVASWREMVRVFFSEVYKKKPTEFRAFAERRRRRFAISNEKPNSLRVPLRIGLSDIWVNGYASGASLYAICESVRIELNIPESDFMCL